MTLKANHRSFQKGDPRAKAAAMIAVQRRKANVQMRKASTDYQKGYQAGRRDVLTAILAALEIQG